MLVYVACITGIDVKSMNTTSKLNSILLVFALVLILVFLILTGVCLVHGLGQGTLFSTTPLWHTGVHLGAVLAGAAAGDIGRGASPPPPE